MRTLAIEAGRIALRIREEPSALRTEEKANNEGPVTQADLQANALIVKSISSAFPDDAIVAEENQQQGNYRHATRCWFIDPIDGTSDFAAGRACWAIHIGLCIDGQPTLGLVYEPEAQRANFGIACRVHPRAWIELPGQEKRPIRIRPLASGADRHAVISASHRTSAVDAALRALQIAPANTRSMGSTGVKSATVARGEANIYVHPSTKTKLWDSCAPQAVLEAAGGRLTGLDGQPIDYKGEHLHHPAGLLATGGISHEQCVEQLASMVKAWLHR